MQLVNYSMNITVLSFGLTCTAQAYHDILFAALQRNNLTTKVNIVSATLEMGFDPCRRLSDMQEYFQRDNIKMHRKCKFWTADMYNTSSIILVQDRESRDSITYLLENDPSRKIMMFDEMDLVLSDNKEEFYNKAKIAAEAFIQKIKQQLQ
ncbi:Conserved_hypothetical protein [Hexamita inflata]|uniref:Uncharacterized protein n=1 Tax=Hexamita inflata TaxID=28002 RepID=A0AA86TMU2_9EUKA|nr:Conserved hypothetical protein [Hexamita inflata]